MYTLATGFLILSFILSAVIGGIAISQLISGKNSALVMIERGQCLITALVSISCVILLSALLNNDFSVKYVASYTDKFLPVFYRLTAFWAGQEGSLLFWAWSVIFCGELFMLSKSYTKLADSTKIWFWLFFMLISCFFLLLLITWSNPFELFTGTPPIDGNGLNPLLQHLGMVFHPPLLFLGYGGFVIPGCLALAQSMNRKRQEEGSWVNITRPFTLAAWLFLSAGIILGAWWAYMELGWGGYWAWDPVENASLIPWLIATASIHISILETKRGKLFKTNAFLMVLTTISAFFATYLVRSGVVKSLHAFSGSKVGFALLVFVLAFIFVALIITSLGEKSEKNLESPISREGILIIVSGLLLVISLLILLATMWPVITDFINGFSSGLDADFYNETCLPIFTGIAVLLAFCPWVSWKGGVKSRACFALVSLIFIASLLALKFGFGMSNPVATIAISASISALASLAMLLVSNRAMLQVPSFVGAHGVHIGLVLIILGIAFSGPFKKEQTFSISPGQAISFRDYTVRYAQSYDGNAPGYTFFEADLEVLKGQQFLGVVSPQLRFYEKKSRSIKSSTLFSLGTEVYTSILDCDPQSRRIKLHLSMHPMVNWIWIGGILLCLFPIIGMMSGKKKEGVGTKEYEGQKED